MSSSDARWVRIGRSLPAGPRSGGRRRDHGQVSRPGRVRPPHVDVVARPARAGDHLPLTSPPGTGAVTQPRFAKWRSRFRFPAGHPGPRRKRSAAGTRAGPDGRLERHSVRRESPREQPGGRADGPQALDRGGYDQRTIVGGSSGKREQRPARSPATTGARLSSSPRPSSGHGIRRVGGRPTGSWISFSWWTCARRSTSERMTERNCRAWGALWGLLLSRCCACG